ncbi:hypothetical protein OLCHANIL_00096 [Vibrio phage V05]|uniref:Uncharacterized protein n=1 Tax=Vibrio phage VH1_2019 TaxID=2686307 RepID=A0A6B9SUD2_9CAUD|nr:hypothetical protein VH12019_00084 [Vibrio phage VH1_2019]QIW90193.1 hypothetical protein OLCHANIL_00096 [Vibrio phage V05]WOL24765.1 hypothetical protein [Vibrio phage PG216]
MKCEICGHPDGYSDGVGMILCNDCYSVARKPLIGYTEDNQPVIVPPSLVDKIKKLFEKG